MINIFKNKDLAFKLMCLAIALIVVGTLCAVLVQTDGGKIEIIGLKLPTEDGQWLTADLYKPKTATAENPAPCVVVVPGFQRTKETQSAYTIELARRGYVVITIDPYAQGDSSSSSSTQAATTQGYGLFAVVEYLTSAKSSLNYVDKNKIGAAGHSAGGNAVVKAAARFGQEVVDGVRKVSRLQAGYVSGYVRSFTAGDLATVRSNMGMSYAYYDEGAYQNETAKAKADGTWQREASIADADMRYAPEAIRFVNSGLKLSGEKEINISTGELEMGQIYGNSAKYTMRIVNNEKTLHALQPYDSVSTSHMLEFFELSFDLDISISTSNQTWWIKEVFQGMMLVGGLMFVLALGALLLKTKFFASLCSPALPERTTPQTKGDKWIFWIVFGCSALIAAFSFIPMAKTAQLWFPTAQGGGQTWFFPQRMNNAVLLWAVLNGVIGFAVFFALYFIRNKKKGETLEAFKLKGVDVLKTLLLSVTVFAAYYLMILVIYTVFRVDFRFFFVSARPVLVPKMLLVALMYMPIFFIFYLSNSVRANLTMRPSNWSETKSTVIACLANSVGLVLIAAVQYIAFAATGTVNWTDEWLYVNMLFSLVPMMVLLPIFNRWFYNRTGKVYLGALISCMVFIMMTLTNTVCYIPL